MPELHDLAAAYALDALDGDERRTFERHLDDCETCRSEVAEFLEAAAALAESGATDPPEGLKGKVMAAIGEPAPVSLLARFRNDRGLRTVTLAVAAVLLLVLATVALLPRPGIDADDVFAASDARVATIAGEGFEAVFTYSVSLRAGVVDSTSLPAVGPDKTYEFWLIDDEPRPAGLFRPEPDGTSRALIEDIRPGLVLGLTVEPAEGSDSPTGTILLTFPIT